MSRIVAIGRETELAGYALAGVAVREADDPRAVRRIWDELEGDVGLVLLTAESRRALADPGARRDVVWAVLPE
jgi:vacuolar-type H+-ATPase subunit F/Vma7